MTAWNTGFGPALLLGGFLFFYQLGAAPLFDLDEAIYAETAREMIETGDWLTPQFNYAPVFDKPILLYWLMAAAFKLFGPSEFSARLISAVFGVALLAALYGLVRAARTPRCGLLAMLILAGSLEMTVLSHAALTDMLLVFFITAAMACFYMVTLTQRGAWTIGLYAALALAVLTKGPVGLVLPGAAIALFIVTTGPRRRLLREIRPVWGLLIFSAIALPWYGAMIQIHGAAFVDSFFLKHNIERFTSVIGSHAGTPFYYLGVLLLGFFPWAAFLPASFLSVVSGPAGSVRWRDLRSLPARRPFEWFLFLWMIVVLGFFTAAGTKLPNYIAPAFPPLAAWTACWWDRRSDPSLNGSAREDRISLVLLWLSAAVFAVLLLTVPRAIEWARGRYAVSAPYLAQPIELDRVLMLLAFILLTGVMSFHALRRPVGRWAGFMILMLMMGSFAFVLLQGLMPSVSGYIQKPLKELSEETTGWIRRDESLILFGLKKPSVLFYARRGAVLLKSNRTEELRSRLSAGRAAVLSPIHLIPILEATPGLVIRSRKGGYVLATNF